VGVAARNRASLAALAAVGLLAGLVPSAASGHKGPPKTPAWRKCKSYIGGRGYADYRGIIYARRRTATTFYARLIPALPFGWSGTVQVNSAKHPRIIIPPSRAHWFPSPVIITGPTRGRYGYRVQVSPNPGVFNNYALEIWAPYRCS
jgi:hypothetical protein